MSLCYMDDGHVLNNGYSKCEDIHNYSGKGYCQSEDIPSTDKNMYPRPDDH